ncbi:MAG: MBL fold metallo-hydrolase [Methanoregula sp.]|nr:MAG: MBL fold metallo-hydrolase [Methanoregula sp.]
MTPQLSLTVLADNTTLTDRYFIGEPGLSFFLTTMGKRILFDTGYSDAFLVNAEKMGINLLDLDMVVLSHGHSDHTGGMFPLIRYMARAGKRRERLKIPSLIAHPHCFCPRQKTPDPDTWYVLPEHELAGHFTVITSTGPLWLTENLVFLGEIERKPGFEQFNPGKRKIVMPDGRKRTDLIRDDSALAFCADDGIRVITGCSHSGIGNIVEHARSVCNKKKVIDIIGGLHLLSPGRTRLRKTGEYLQGLHLKSLHACHCTSLASKIALAGYCPVKETGVGTKIEW